MLILRGKKEFVNFARIEMLPDKRLYTLDQYEGTGTLKPYFRKIKNQFALLRQPVINQ